MKKTIFGEMQYTKGINPNEWYFSIIKKVEYLERAKRYNLVGKVDGDKEKHEEFLIALCVNHAEKLYKKMTNKRDRVKIIQRIDQLHAKAKIFIEGSKKLLN